MDSSSNPIESPLKQSATFHEPRGAPSKKRRPLLIYPQVPLVREHRKEKEDTTKTKLIGYNDSNLSTGSISLQTSIFSHWGRLDLKIFSCQIHGNTVCVVTLAIEINGRAIDR